jgi:hypothetical protein
VQFVQPRGAAVAPEPYRESNIEPSASAHARQWPLSDRAAEGGPIGEFFAVLGNAWLLTAEQRARLAPAVRAALETGWTSAALVAFAGAKPLGGALADVLPDDLAAAAEAHSRLTWTVSEFSRQWEADKALIVTAPGHQRPASAE